MKLPNHIEKIQVRKNNLETIEKNVDKYFKRPLLHKQIHGSHTYVELDTKRLGY
ncbi:hypothetical protein ACTHQ4_20780 [Alkalicoccobacillus gibsonii]|uniref:hypothetical protein n=1 Tax=Alkalicoccobacillus gibsonii TaxID=79881 RepID=UPI003F7B6F83